jgi:hypothetical protein
VAGAAVSWVTPASNGSAITGYLVTPYRNGVAQPAQSFDASTTTRTLTGLTTGASCTFTVAAVNAVGTSTASPLSNAVVPYTVPGQPVITAAAAGDDQATSTWTAPANGGSPITGYIITPYIGAVPQTPQSFTGTATTGGQLRGRRRRSTTSAPPRWAVPAPSTAATRRTHRRGGAGPRRLGLLGRVAGGRGAFRAWWRLDKKLQARPVIGVGYCRSAIA